VLLRPRSRLSLLLLLLLGSLALAQSVRIVRSSPEVRRAAPGRTVTHVFVLYGSGPVRVRLDSEHGWPLLTPEREVQLSPGRPLYYPVTLRVPAQAAEGRRDRLTVRAGAASAIAYTEVSYLPGLQLRLPATASYLPPSGRFTLEVANTGNGADTARIRVETMDGAAVFYTRLRLEAGERRKVQVPVSETGVMRVRVRLERGRLQREGFVRVRWAAASEDGDAFRLLGRFTAAYNYPGSLSFSVGAAGPLSDFASLSVGAGYAPGSVPAGSANLNWRSGYLNAVFGPSYGLALGLFEGGVSTQIAISGPVPRGSLSFDAAGPGYGLGASMLLNADPGLRFYTRLTTAAESERPFQSGILAAELGLRPFRPRMSAGLDYGFSYRGWPVGLQGGFSGWPGSLFRYRFSADVSPDAASFGGRVSWTGLGVEDWGLALASSSSRLGLESPLPFYFGAAAKPENFRVYAGTRLDLPAPWKDLDGRLDLEYEGGSWSFKVSGSSLAGILDGLALGKAGAWLGWPLDQNGVSLGIRAGGSFLRGSAGLTWHPWAPSLDTRLDLELLTARTTLKASLHREWYGGGSGFSLSAELPWVVEVPPGVSETFGGRRAGVLAGVVEVAGPPALRQGIVVRAGAKTAVTDAAGRFEMWLPPGEYRVEIDRTRLPATLVVVRDGVRVSVRPKRTTRVRLRVASSARIEGRVKIEGPLLQEPPRFAVAIQDARGRQTSLYTEADGSFFVGGLAPGTYAVRLLGELLPPGWRVLAPEATVRLQPGESARVELVAAPPEPQVFRGGLQIISVEPEVAEAPPGAAPLVRATVEGPVQEVEVRSWTALLGKLSFDPETGVWIGRVRLPEDYAGPLPLQLVARGGDREARFPFLVTVSEKAPWGRLRLPPLARPGSELPLAVHWYLPLASCWLQLGEARLPLQGAGADWWGSLAVPTDVPGDELSFKVVGVLADGRRIELAGWVAVKK